jgi:hypothetical protein
MRGALGKQHRTGLVIYRRDQMLFLLIPTAWIAVAAFFVALCVMAARGDDALALIEEPLCSRTSLGELVVWERAPLLAARIGSHAGVRTHAHDALGVGVGGPAASTRAGVRARGSRGRGGRCAAGS